MKALILGANGQDGKYLARICRDKGIDVIGVSRSGGEWIAGSVTDRDLIKQLIKKNRPKYIFHLAANSTTRHRALFENYETISTGVLNVLESVKRYSPDSRVFITGSGLQFKNSGIPISEKDDFEPSSAYSLARIQSVYSARYYRTLGIKSYVGYLFHHESPFRKNTHVSQYIAQAAKKIARGEQLEKLLVGDLSVIKEWTFAGDVARGIFTLISQEEVFEAVIGSGKGYSIKKWVEECFSCVGLDWHDYVEIRGDYSAEYKFLVSDPTTIKALGWNATVDISSLARMMVASEVNA